MQQELNRSVMSPHLIEQQMATLQLTPDQYLSFGKLTKPSQALISRLQRADQLDRILLTRASTFFVLACLYILKKRILDRSVSLLPTLLSPTTAQIITNNKQAAVAIASTGAQDVLLGASAEAAAAAVTTYTVAFIPSLASPNLPPAVAKLPLTPTPANPSVPQMPEIELLHEEL
ncbi:hypothetical protein PtA15_14A324 [Puccinia triticina]|uniref:Sec20 C-terminal domain-containing protein n=1 Tax=Puccinia triticina TaxID=208348 RepID=A0ABY7D3I4_9BASI|nr:uncharacterized protein PtA15_14A324 [Puccinia triticina]WAQ91440.1 hypothetical protein PtA15_14A324 [Puccinia triticina]WAR62247.1 hypothetical protein PtB15_14B342 [Puccinia triticina]